MNAETTLAAEPASSLVTTDETWSFRLTRSIAGQIRRYRKQRKWSAQRLSDECANLGLDFPRSTLADLENGRRRSISVAEMLVVAKALELDPASLLIPPEGGEPAEMLPAEFLRTALADGPRPTRDIEKEAREGHQIAKRTLDRARSELRVAARKVGADWWISLPGHESELKDLRPREGGAALAAKTAEGALAVGEEIIRTRISYAPVPEHPALRATEGLAGHIAALLSGSGAAAELSGYVDRALRRVQIEVEELLEERAVRGAA